jgi:DNA repair protein RadD
VANIFPDECHLIPHSESGMYREFLRGFPGARQAGFSGTVFRLQGGSLVEGEGAPFDKVVYTYSIIDGIRDGYLVPAFSAPADDKIDVTKLKQGGRIRYRVAGRANARADGQPHRANDPPRREPPGLAGVRGVGEVGRGDGERLKQWGMPAGLVLGTTPPGERAATIAAFRAGRLRCLVNVAALTTGFDVQEVDMLVMRRATMSLGLYIQMTGRLLRTIGGNIEMSISARQGRWARFGFRGQHRSSRTLGLHPPQGRQVETGIV